jgi:2-polyprenyl-6-methoxyphenol hydroxylase-like FAD-dependent oxidoreductase
MADARTLTTGCCIAGGGPAGVMLGFLLARAGVDVVVLEKHADFLRDFRGDTVHPSTLEVMYELGLIDEFLKRPHQELRTVNAKFGEFETEVADLRHLPTHCKFIAMMPQWDFLDFLADEGRKLPRFHLHMDAEVEDIVVEDGRVTGVTAQTPDGPLTVKARLVVGADGRRSTVREKAGLKVLDLGSTIDVLWMRIPREEGDPPQSLGRIDTGRIFVMLDRGDYWQAAYVIRKGGIEEVKASGLPALRRSIAAMAPELTERLETLATWDDVKLLSVSLDRLQQWWRPGLICIGDSAHAMSPVGGIGINLAIQDAVAAANILAGPLLRGTPSDADLAAVQKRRLFPTRATQAAQRAIQENVIQRVLNDRAGLSPPLAFRMLRRFPILRRLPALAIGVGVRPEHVRTQGLPPSPH